MIRLTRPILTQVLVFLLVFLFFWQIREYSQISIFQERDLFRGGLFAQGKFFLYGPELSGGGNLPGPFYYGLLGLSQVVRTGWQSAFALLAGLHALGIALLFGFFLRRFGNAAAWIFLAVSFLFRFLHDQVMFFWNPSFLPFLTFIYLIFCERIYFENRWSLRFRFLLFFFCGVCIQFHSLGVIFFLHAMIDAHWLRRRPWKEAVVNAIFFLLPSVPFLVTLALAPKIHPGDFAGVLTYLNRYLQKDYSLTSSPGDVEALKRWSLRVFVVGALAAIPFLRKSAFFRSCSLLFLFALVPALVALRENYAGRYGTIVAAVAVILVAGGLLRLRRAFVIPILILGTLGEVIELAGHPAYLPLLEAQPFALLAATLLALAGALLLTGSNWKKSLASIAAFSFLLILISTSMRVHSIKHHRIPLNGNEFVARKIYENTGWPFEEAERRVFFVNIRHDFGLYYSYLDATREGMLRADHPEYHGFFVIQIRKEGYAYEESERKIPALALKIVFEKIRLEKTVAAALRNGELELFDGWSDYGVAVVPYRVKPGSVAPRGFHNYGRTYLSAPFELNAPDPEGSYRFVFHDCEQPGIGCDILARVRLKERAENPRQTEAIVSIDGTPISQAHFALFPDWAETLISPYLAFQCGKGPVQHREIAGRIGSLAEKEFLAYHGLTSNFLAPYGHEIFLDCPKNQLKQIGFGFSSSFGMSYKTGRGRTLPGREVLRSTAAEN